MEITLDGGRIISAHFNGKSLKTDFTTQAGEEFKIPTPFELFLISTATCASVKIQLFCEQRKIPTDKIKISQEVDYDKNNDLPTNIRIDVKLPDDFPVKYKKALVKTANLCKVKRTIASQPNIEVKTN